MSGSAASQDVLASTPPCEKKSAPLREMKTRAGRARNTIEKQSEPLFTSFRFLAMRPLKHNATLLFARRTFYYLYFLHVYRLNKDNLQAHFVSCKAFFAARAHAIYTRHN